MTDPKSLEEIVKESLSSPGENTRSQDVDPLNGWKGPISPRENQMDPESLAELDALNAERGVPTHFAEELTWRQEKNRINSEVVTLVEILS